MPEDTRLQALLASIAEFVGTDDQGEPTEDPKVMKARAKIVANALRTKDSPKLNPVAQWLLDAGAGRKHSETEPRITQLEGQVETLTAERDTAVAALEAAKGEPEERYKILERKHDKAVTDLAAAKKELEEERGGRVTDKTQLIRDRVVAKLRGKVKDSWLDKVVAPDIEKQIKQKPDKSFHLLPPGDEIPYEGATVEDQIPMLAEDMLAQVPADYRISRSEEGAGGAGTGGLGGKQPTPEENKKKLRKTGAY